MPFQVHSRRRSRRSPNAGRRTHAHAATDWRPRRPGLALGVTGADCGMILFADTARARHRRGACGLEGRADRGGRGDRGCDGAARRQARRYRRRARALHRPRVLRGRSGVRRRFRRRRRRHGALLHAEPRKRATRCSTSTPISPSARRALGSARFEDLGLDTYADERRFFSYRRATHRKEPDYGRLMSAIVLK